jgi:hypothetical protein
MILWIFHLPQLSILPRWAFSGVLDEAYRSADHGAFSMSAQLALFFVKAIFSFSGVWRFAVELIQINYNHLYSVQRY